MAQSVRPTRRLRMATLGTIALVAAAIGLALGWPQIRKRYAVHQLLHGDEAERVLAQAWLEQHRPDDLLPLFRDLVRAPYPETRYLAVDTLGKYSEEGDLAGLVHVLGDPDSNPSVPCRYSAPYCTTAMPTCDWPP